ASYGRSLSTASRAPGPTPIPSQPAASADCDWVYRFRSSDMSFEGGCLFFTPTGWHCPAQGNALGTGPTTDFFTPTGWHCPAQGRRRPRQKVVEQKAKPTLQPHRRLGRVAPEAEGFVADAQLVTVQRRPARTDDLDHRRSLLEQDFLQCHPPAAD